MRNNPIVYLFSMMWRFSEGNRGRVMLYVVLSAIANASILTVPLIVAKIVNTIQEQGVSTENISFLLFLASLFIVQSLVFWSLHGPSRVLERNNAFLVDAQYKKHLLNGTLALPLQWHTDHHSGDTIDKIEKGTKALQEFSSSTFEYIDACVRFFGSLTVLIFFDSSAIAIALVITIIAVSILIKFDKRLVSQYKELNHAENDISAKIYDVISNISTVIVLRIEALLSKEIIRTIMKPFALYKKNVALNETKWFVVGMSSSVMAFLILGSYLWGAVSAGEVIMLGTLTALYQYTQRITDLFSYFAYLYGRTLRWHTSVLNAEELAADFARFPGKTANIHHHDWKTCAIDNLTFSYDESGARKHLDAVSLSLTRGENIAVIGESGSGKTTLLKIMRGLYEPQEVNVSLDGATLPAGFDALSYDIALIPQDPEIFTTTIRRNITVGIERSDAAIARYTDMARFSNVLERLPKGLESSIVEKGVNLSGGEKQRLALARGLMASEDKSIILLDESTSSVDTHNEVLIYEHILSEYEDKTIIASIHRLHLLRLFDRVYLFKDGRIEDSGTFDGLLATSEDFARMWEKYTKSREKDV